MPRISVLLCTHNPNPSNLARCISALNDQTIPSELWELLLIDNNSSPPISCSALGIASWINSAVLREPELGLTPARLAGIAAARGDVLVFVDDDNVLAPSYLVNALSFMDNEPRVGVAGGILEPEYEVTPPQWIKPFLNLLGIRDFGPRPIQALIYGQVGPWEPVGAGMVIRACIADFYTQLAKDPLRRSLDRRGRSLASCGDTDMARCAPDLGYFQAYEPSLKLVHLVPAFRLRFSYILRLVHGIHRSGVLLSRIRNGHPSPLGSPLHAALCFWFDVLRQFTLRPRHWILRIAAITGEVQARMVRLCS